MRQKGDKSKAEAIKEQSEGLRGNLRAELSWAAPSFSSDTATLAKFHGIYQYDDRDARRTRLKEGQGKSYRFMVRTKNPGGGQLTAAQWLALDHASDLYGDGTLRLTTRQDVQFHGVTKGDLKSLIRFLNFQLINTFGACGDGVRNVVACPVASIAPDASFDSHTWADLISRSLAFRTKAYVEVWLDDEQVLPPQEEPLFGKAYLPRKFKIALSGEQENCVDVFTNDVGLIPVVERGALQAFQVLVGGGLGASHGNAQTYPRLATPLCRIPPDDLVRLLETVVAAYRDLGDRSNRKHARLKYVIEEQGIDAFRAEVERRFGRALDGPGEVRVGPCVSHVGWGLQKDGRSYFGLFVENGRLHDRGPRLKTALREIVERFNPTIALTPDQNLVLMNLPPHSRAELPALLKRHDVPAPDEVSRLRLGSMACPALPSCGLALGEAERRLPGLISELERLGCGDEPVSIRMSGCPNSCSRPPVAEVGLVGKSADGYHVYLGGSPRGDRLASLYRENVASAELPALIASLIESWRSERYNQEPFGDWTHRVGLAGASNAPLVALEQAPALEEN